MSASQNAISADLNAFLGPGCEYDGRLTFEGSVRIDGKFAGEIFTNDILLIGEEAVVKAEIEAGTVVVSGTVEGNIAAKKLVEVKAPAIIRGNIKTPSLTIEQGVIFQGHCAMEEKASAAKQATSNVSTGPTPGGVPPKKDDPSGKISPKARAF